VARDPHAVLLNLDALALAIVLPTKTAFLHQTPWPSQVFSHGSHQSVQLCSVIHAANHSRTKFKPTAFCFSTTTSTIFLHRLSESETASLLYVKWLLIYADSPIIDLVKTPGRKKDAPKRTRAAAAAAAKAKSVISLSLEVNSLIFFGHQGAK